MHTTPDRAGRETAPGTVSDLDISKMRTIRTIPYGRILSVGLIVLAAFGIVRAFAMGDINWAITWQYMFWPTIMMGLFNTIWMSIVCMAIGVVIGLMCAIARDSVNPVLRGASIFYTWFFRGAPLILQLLIWFNLALVFPRLSLFGLFEARTVEVITPVTAAILGFGLNAGAYASEIIRAGLLGVDRGQFEAAKAIGMTGATALRRIVLPQAMRTVLPPLGNEFISMIKMTSLASIIGFSDLLRSVQNLYFVNTRVIELLMVATVWYLVVVTILSIFQQMLERRFGRGFVRRAQR
ncbi:amino acid ABC transporter permease [Arsenicitalea aurantiaca]|uniref:Glutamate/aspartate import permease protein GltK n=1 Tax=Arsenicitalea aurantiaca TaxID=1783274 RepID=A0A433X7K2_9HYPH|nr:amino acid ABC transporter permease [Arsenicitalea aurantiaca]RUT30071.1 amino acid ABC transporter permease [Arsenicitalea aurantiaca]